MEKRGLILTYPVGIQGDGAFLELASLPAGTLPNIPPYNGRCEYLEGGARFANDVVALPDPGELRRAILYWDFVWRPELRFVPGIVTTDEKFLVECGVYSVDPASWIKPEPWPGLSDYITETYQSCFEREEETDPGAWVVSHGEGGLDIQPSDSLQSGRGAVAKLCRALPVPCEDVPLQDLLEFRQRRKEEIDSLRFEIDGLFSRVVNSQDTDFEFRRAVSEIDQKCADVVKVGRESKISFSLSDVSYNFSFEFNSANLLMTSGLGALIGTNFEMPVVGAAIGAGTSVFKFGLSLGGGVRRATSSIEHALTPYRVVSRIVNETI
ncbi:hypothetical protein DS901_13375 [Loktanella sp. D2R18]|uniref:DUF6236 family protein n=1 Tax=Rhodobacterales TaxID=204455 RepID=UPI000DE93CD5|nr:MULTISPECIES: DUF6236 family protein [Rhodobacterales]MDO6591729.1 DUF6236 family protein [Yoonia sp. 1_MG-2023]RBW42549.1 hypothetical protein DS901_13375 [Loktanella sp. D2R18]